MKRIVALVSILLVALLIVLWERREEARDLPTVEPRAEAPSRSVALEAPSDLARPDSEPRSEAGPAVAPVPVAATLAAAADDAAARAAHGVYGRVLDDLGLPVTRFELEFRERGNWSGRSYATGREEPSRAKVEDSRGEFRIGTAGQGEWMLTAHGAGSARSTPMLVRLPGTEMPIELTIPRPASLLGRVTTHDGAPLDGARIFVHVGPERLPSFDFGRPPEPDATSDALGRFHVPATFPGGVRVLARHPQHCESVWTEVELQPGGATEVLLVMQLGGRVVGRIDPAYGDTANRELSLIPSRGTIGWTSARSDGTGRFVIEHVVPMEYVAELREANASQASPSTSPSLSVRKRISVRAGETTTVEFAPSNDRLSVRGRVSCQGQAISGVEVLATPDGAGAETRNAVKTQLDGRFVLQLDAPGDYIFWVCGDQGTLQSQTIRVPPDPMDEVVIEVSCGSLSGTVRSKDGRALADVLVTVLRVAVEGEDELRSFGRRYRRTDTDADGRFEFGLLPAGTYEVRAPDGFFSDTPPPRNPYGRAVLICKVDGATVAPRIEMTLPSEGRLHGRILTPDGTSVDNAVIKVIDDKGVAQSAYFDARSDATGSFEVLSLAAGTYRVLVRKGERRCTSEPVVVEEGKTAALRIELP